MLLLYIPWVVMFLGIIKNVRVTLPKEPSSTILPTFSFLGENVPSPHLLENKQNSNPNLLCNVGQIQLWLIKSTCFTYLLLQTKPVIITFNFKHGKVVISSKWRKCNNFFKPLINGNVKYTKSLNSLFVFTILFYFEELYSDTA